MIVFDVKCGKGHVFEGWFADGASFEAQAGNGDVACPICGDTSVGKAPMAPNVSTPGPSAKGADTPPETSAPDGERVALAKRKTGRTLAMMRAVREHVERNFENVGETFAEEARKIHYGESGKRSIYGRATRRQAEDLRDEGVEFGELPCPPKFDG